MASSKDGEWRADGGIVLRTPLFPMSALVEWGESRSVPEARRYLESLLARPEVDEAVFVASPSLHDALAAWRRDPNSSSARRAEPALVKYVARMIGRATPFGLFSGVSAGTLGRETKLELAARGTYRRRTRIDNDYLFLLATNLADNPEHRERLTYRPSSSIYRVAGAIRYAAARLSGKERIYHLVSVDPTPYLEATLSRAAAGARLSDLAAALVDDEITVEEARTYVDELVDAQLLVPDLGVYVTGPEPIDGMIAQLDRAGIADARDALTRARDGIAALDGRPLGVATDPYRAVADGLGSLSVPIELSRLFQVDLVKPASAELGRRVAAEVARTITTLATYLRGGDAARVDDLKQAFLARWEDREVPLAEVLDEETGIGFEAARGPGSEGSPLLAGMRFPPAAADSRTQWSPLSRFLLGRIAEVERTGSHELVLSEDDLRAVAAQPGSRLPDAFAAMIRLEAGRSPAEPEIFLEGVSGPSGARLLGRFCHASAAIHEMVTQHHRAEEELRPGAVFAEVVHLNEGRIGNILCRPVLRGHEIVYLGLSGAPAEQQIGLDDLYVSVRGDRIVLRSRRLGKEVVPRLTTAHNYRLRSLGVYRFLCALASQGVEGVGWSWGALQSAPFLPRVRVGSVLVSRAQWNLDKRDLEPVTAAVRAKSGDREARILAAIGALRDARRLPRYVALAAGDNELPVDLDNPLLALALADELAGSSQVEIVEMFPAPGKELVSGPEGRFTAEIVLPFTRGKPRPTIDLPPRDAPAIRRSFGPGSEWLYAKIYCGTAIADRVLRDAVAPVVREALASGAASRWFFLRYADPDPHVRVRWCGDPAALAGTVLPALDRALAPLIAVGAVRKLVLDTYDREIERYGGDRGIELVEDLFWRDSEAVLGIVELLDGDAGADARWRLAVRGIESFLIALGLDRTARAKVYADAKESMGREMRADTALWGQIGDLFARERAALEALFTPDPARDEAMEISPGLELLHARDQAIAATCAELMRRDAAGELVPGVQGLAWSVVHMHVNRLLHASQRAQELVLYDLLRRLHAAQRARGAPDRVS